MHLVLQIQRDVSKDAYLLGWTASILGHHGWRELQETTSQIVARSGKEHGDQFTLGNRNDEDALVAGGRDIPNTRVHSLPCGIVRLISQEFAQNRLLATAGDTDPPEF